MDPLYAGMSMPPFRSCVFLLGHLKAKGKCEGKQQTSPDDLYLVFFCLVGFFLCLLPPRLSPLAESHAGGGVVGFVEFYRIYWVLPGFTRF